MSIVEELRQNDPAETRIRILLHRETSDAALAQALEHNPFVTDIVLDLEGVQQTDWDSLLRVIAARANLEKVELRDAVICLTEEMHPPRWLAHSCKRFSRTHAIRNVAVAMATSSHRYIYICGQCIFNHIIQAV